MACSLSQAQMAARGADALPAGQPLDPCYHQACDTVNNLNLKALGEMKNAAADAVYQLALIQGPIRDGRPVKAKALKSNSFLGDTPLR